jgi:hypothetical protein
MIEEPAVLNQLFVTSLTALSSTVQNTLTNDLTSLSVTNDSVIDVDSAGNALRVTQRGPGNALVVEDSVNPDATPFVVTGQGRVGIGTLSPEVTLDVTGPARAVTLSAQSLNVQNIDVTGSIKTETLSAENVNVQNVVMPAEGGYVINDAVFFGNLTVFGAISSLSGINVTSTTTTQSSALSVINAGSNVALFVSQVPNTDGVATFIGSDIEVLKINNPTPNPDNLPAVVVSGVLSASGGSSTTWNTAFNRTTIFSSVSGRYNSSSTVVESNSANWNRAANVATIVQNSSASWEESADILPTVTNYLSTQSVIISTLTVANVITANSFVVPRKFATNIGNGSLTAFVVTHNLGTRDVITSVYDNSTYENIITSIANLTTNTVGLSFDTAPSTNAYRVVVIG